MKLQEEQNLTEHGVEICLLKETHLESKRALNFANYFCYRTDLLKVGGGSPTLDRRDTDNNAVPVWNLQHLEATATH